MRFGRCLQFGDRVTWALLIFALFVLTAHGAEKRISQSAPFTTLERGAAWSDTAAPGAVYVLSPLASTQGLCVYISNNNPTTAHTHVLMYAYQTGDAKVNNYSASSTKYTSLSVRPAYDFTVGTSATAGRYIQTSGAAKIALRIINTAEAGTPDTFDLQVAQTTQTGCGGVAIGPMSVQGPDLVGATVDETTSFPLQIGSENPDVPGLRRVSGASGATNHWHLLTTAKPACGGVNNVPSALTTYTANDIYLAHISVSNVTGGASTLTVNELGTGFRLWVVSVPANSTMFFAPNVPVQVVGGFEWNESVAATLYAKVCYFN